MHALGLAGRTRHRFKQTTIADKIAIPASTLLNRNFLATGPDQKWATDLTYVDTSEGFLYLAVIQDLFAGRIVGWAMADNIQMDLCLRALQMTVQERTPLPGLLHHSDRGAQFTNQTYRQQLASHGIICSMSRKGNCWDNAHGESIFGRIKE